MSWRRYLTATRASTAERYPVTEEAAWQRLREELSQLDSRATGRSFAVEEAHSHPGRGRSIRGPQDDRTRALLAAKNASQAPREGRFEGRPPSWT
jgi:hypothetical protein